MSNREAWRLLFPTWGRFFTFAFRTHFPYWLLALAISLVFFGDTPAFIFSGGAAFFYFLVFSYKVSTLRNELRQDVSFREEYLGMTDAERRVYFRKRGFLDFTGFNFG